jgi:hypothetical protein
VSAKSLTVVPDIHQMKHRAKITRIHFACDRNQVTTANGCLSDALLLGLMIVKGVNPRNFRRCLRSSDLPSSLMQA